MDEFKEVMGQDTAELMDSRYGRMGPMEAMERLRRHLNSEGGAEAINSDPKSAQLITAIACLTDDEIAAWVNSALPDPYYSDLVNLDILMKKYRNNCRKNLGMGPAKTNIN